MPISVPKRTGTTQHIIDEVSRLCNISSGDLIVVEIYRSNIHRVFALDDSILMIMANDDVRVYELARSSAPHEDLFLFVYNRYRSQYSSTVIYTAVGVPRCIRFSRTAITLDSAIVTLLDAFKFALNFRLFFNLIRVIYLVDNALWFFFLLFLFLSLYVQLSIYCYINTSILLKEKIDIDLV